MTADTALRARWRQLRATRYSLLAPALLAHETVTWPFPAAAATAVGAAGTSEFDVPPEPVGALPVGSDTWSGVVETDDPPQPDTARSAPRQRQPDER